MSGFGVFVHINMQIWRPFREVWEESASGCKCPEESSKQWAKISFPRFRDRDRGLGRDNYNNKKKQTNQKCREDLLLYQVIFLIMLSFYDIPIQIPFPHRKHEIIVDLFGTPFRASKLVKRNSRKELHVGRRMLLRTGPSTHFDIES